VPIDYEKNDIPALVESKLRDVNLVVQAHAEVRTYSGGMKRRLSILLSTIGNPKVIFLDEPTTGLDPVNKRFIWIMIQKMKKQRSVILTTHSMEEADFLSDRIGVVVEGNFKCIGSPIDLKKTYGSGYLLTFGKEI
jgi:ABC-type multidrug transport system ATPase subunit